MNELIAFLNARLDEDEATARPLSAGGNWNVTINGVPGWGLEGDRRMVEHMVRHDPARVLADVAAKRAIVAACAYNLEYEEYGHTLAERVLRALALPYADHEDYKPHWRPRDV